MGEGEWRKVAVDVGNGISHIILNLCPGVCVCGEGGGA